MSKKVLITSALPYVNNVPHLGNLIGAVLSADVYARFCRQMGYETLYICGSDEHGTATETKAKEAGITPQELCDKYYALHKEIYEWFNISFTNNHFGRTSLENHHHIVQDLFRKVVEHGFVVEETVTQPYSVQSQMFLADRFIVGTCPHCQFDSATGDQCDNCGKLLNPQELINPKSKIDGTTPEFKETDHLFLDLEKLQPILEEWVQNNSASWSENAIKITQAWFKDGLKKRAITRDLKWGIPIPDTEQFGDKYKDKVFYVWFDAPIGYISLTQQAIGDDYQTWWHDEQVELVQFMGKDNVPFHSIIFPATLIAAGNGVKEPAYHLVNRLSVTEYLNYENTKFSKRNNVGIFGDDAMKSGIPADVYRYTLMFYRPENADTQFTWKGLQERLNNELIANFGNFVNRTLSFTNRFFEGKTVTVDETRLDEAAQLFLADFRKESATYIELLKDIKLRDALMQFMKISSLCNQYFQSSAPWKSREEHPQKSQTDLTLLIHAVKDLAIMCEPFMPSTSQEIFKQLNAAPVSFENIGVLSVQDHTIGEASVLFTKLEDKEVQVYKAQFGSSSTSQEKKKEAPKKQEKKEQPKVDPLNPEDVQFTVGQITKIARHPNADKLYIEQVDIGGETIQILSGLVPYYKEDELLGKKIFVVRNLKPAKMRGEMSHGMLLAAQNDDESIIEVLDAKDFELGDSFSSAPKPEIGFEEFMTIALTVTNHHVAINGQPFKIKDKQISTQKVKDGIVR